MAAAKQSAFFEPYLRGGCNMRERASLGELAVDGQKSMITTGQIASKQKLRQIFV
jgi:hypothetical protein